MEKVKQNFSTGSGIKKSASTIRGLQRVDDTGICLGR